MIATRHRTEDWHGRYWPVEIEHGQCQYVEMCADPTCVEPVVIRRDVTDRWFAAHKTWDWRRPCDSPSTVSSPRFEHWQEAAAWAADNGIVDERWMR